LEDRHGTAVAEEVIRQFNDEGLIDDVAFARERAWQLAVSRLAGNRVIEADLGKRGIDRSVAAQAIAAVREELSEGDALHRLLEKKKAALSGGHDRSWRDKTGRYLLAKGFPANLIYEILKDEV
jgi:regulatory protein